MTLEIELPLEMEGKFIKELVLTSLLGFGRNNLGLVTENNKVIIKNKEYFKDVLSYYFYENIDKIKEILIKNARLPQYVKAVEIYLNYINPNINILAESNKSNKGKKQKEKTKDIIDNVFKKLNKDKIRDFINRMIEGYDKEKSQQRIIRPLFPILVAELMEAERWFGGFEGKSGKKNKKLLDSVDILLFTLAILALARYQLISFYVENKGTYYVIATVDTEVQSQLCKPLIKNKDKLRGIVGTNLSQLSLIFILSAFLEKAGCQQLILLNDNNRVDILEKNSYSFIRPFIEFWNLLEDKTKDNIFVFVKTCLKEGIADTVNKFSNYIFQGISGILSPSEVIYFIARETFLKDENIEGINSYVLEDIRNALEVLTHIRRYSA